MNRIDPAGLACDVFSVGVSGSAGWGGGVLSGGLGFAVGGTNLGLYTQQGAGVGTPGFGGQVTLSCLNEVPPAPGTSAPGNPLDALRGEGANTDFSPGYLGTGGDASYNSDGSKSLSGGHFSLGLKTPNASAQTTGTQVICLTCWSWPWETPDAANPEVDPSADGRDSCAPATVVHRTQAQQAQTMRRTAWTGQPPGATRTRRRRTRSTTNSWRPANSRPSARTAAT